MGGNHALSRYSSHFDFEDVIGKCNDDRVSQLWAKVNFDKIVTIKIHRISY